MSTLLRLLCPNEFAESVPLIDIRKLKEQGIRALLLDLDNTLVRWQGCDISPEVAEWVRTAGEHGLRVCIVSNTRTPRRLRRLADELEVPYTKRAAKPRRVGFREGLALLDAQPGEAAVIGDQVFTDILGGNRLGAYTILVRPLHRKEFFGTKVSRLFEKFILKLLKRRGMLSDSTRADQGEQSAQSERQMKTE